MDKEQQGIADARLICEELHGELPEGEQYGSVEIAMILSRRVRELEAIASPVARSNKLQDLIAHIEGALINSEGKDFKVSADFVRDELIPSLASLSAEPERIAQLIAHRACCSGEHDPASGKLHGCCVVCGVPWPCEYAGTPPAPPEREVSAEPVRRQCGYCHSWVSRNCGEGCMRDPVKDPTEAMLDSEREGFVSVPREPTEAMLDAAKSYRDGAVMRNEPWTSKGTYKAMLAASQEREGT